MANASLVYTHLPSSPQTVSTRNMTFKTKPHKFRVDIAPTNRARCRACKRTIPKGSVRLVTVAFVCPGRATSFMRCAPQCIDTACAAAVLAVYGSPERLPIDAAVSSYEAKRIRDALTPPLLALPAQQPGGAGAVQSTTSKGTEPPALV